MVTKLMELGILHNFPWLRGSQANSVADNMRVSQNWILLTYITVQEDVYF